MSATVAWIAATPVKGLRLQHRSEVSLTLDGIPGDRAFFLVDEAGAMVSASGRSWRSSRTTTRRPGACRCASPAATS
jgi:uncharacterized protein YcbX